MDIPKINLHVHSNFSDGKNSIIKIVLKSIKLGLDHIAITDHFSNSWKAGVIPTLNNSDKISRYLQEIRDCQEFLRSSKNKKLRLYRGIEIDLESSKNFIQKYVNAKEFDIILFEYLECPESIAFITSIIKNWKKKASDEYFPILGLAHFDPSNFIHGSLDILIQFLKKYDIYFEFNSRYPEYYSRRNELFFEKLREHRIPVAIGCDSHNIKRLVDIEEPWDMLRFYDLEDNLIAFMDDLKKLENHSK